MLSKTGGDAKKVTPNQVKSMQAALAKLGPKDKLTAARARSLLEIAHDWKKRNEPGASSVNHDKRSFSQTPPGLL